MIGYTGKLHKLYNTILKYTILHIYIYSDIGVSSNLIGLLPLAYGQCPFPREGGGMG